MVPFAQQLQFTGVDLELCRGLGEVVEVGAVSIQLL